MTKGLLNSMRKIWDNSALGEARAALPKAVAILITGLALTILCAVAFVSLSNREYNGRSAFVLDLNKPSVPAPWTVTLVLHRLLPDENAVEVSVAATARYGDLDPSMRDRDDCATVTVSNRWFFEFDFPRQFSVNCRLNPRTSSVDLRSDRFIMPLSANPDGFPFDSFELPFFLDLTGEGTMVNAKFTVVKLFSGRLIRQTGAYPNNEVRIERSGNDQLLIVTSGALFLLLTSLIGWRLFFSGGGLSNVQEVIAVASYIIAAASFRDLLGVTQTTGTTMFEILVFGLPMCLMCIGVAVSSLVDRQTKPNNVQPNADV